MQIYSTLVHCTVVIMLETHLMRAVKIKKNKCISKCIILLKEVLKEAFMLQNIKDLKKNTWHYVVIERYTHM